MSTPEWGFDVPPEQVDIDRVWRELGYGVAIQQYAYLAEMRMKAPRTYARLKERALERGWGKTWCTWPDPEPDNSGDKHALPNHP